MKVPQEQYQTIHGFVSYGRDMLAIKLDIAGSNLPDLGYENKAAEKIRHLAYEMVEKVKQEVIALQRSLDPELVKHSKEERDAILAIFPEPIYVEEVPNQYSNDAYYRMNPWYIVTTKIGRITIGPRKRVIEINWEGTLTKATARDLFPDENVTKEGRLIHAWSIEDAKRYVDKVMASTEVQPKENWA